MAAAVLATAPVHHLDGLRSPAFPTGDRVRAAARPNVMRVVELPVIVPFFSVQTYAPDTPRSLRADIHEDFAFRPCRRPAAAAAKEVAKA